VVELDGGGTLDEVEIGGTTLLEVLDGGIDDELLDVDEGGMEDEVDVSTLDVDEIGASEVELDAVGRATTAMLPGRFDRTDVGVGSASSSSEESERVGSAGGIADK
jgi:hypothetical protein